MLSKEKQEKPNILLFLADDMTWRDCQPYGNNDVLTPNMSRLAGEGMCFNNMFTATAMCAPTRQQLYTGLFPVRSGAYPNHSRVYDGVKSLGHHFGELGYRVALLGKKHYGPNNSNTSSISTALHRFTTWLLPKGRESTGPGSKNLPGVRRNTGLSSVIPTGQRRNCTTYMMIRMK